MKHKISELKETDKVQHQKLNSLGKELSTEFATKLAQTGKIISVEADNFKKAIYRYSSDKERTQKTTNAYDPNQSNGTVPKTKDLDTKGTQSRAVMERGIAFSAYVSHFSPIWPKDMY